MFSRRAFAGIIAGGGAVAAPTNSKACSSDGLVPEVSSVVEGGRARLGPERTVVRTAGFRVAGDGGGGLYRRVASEPRHLGKFRSADGGWWELAEPVVHTGLLGRRREVRLVRLYAEDAAGLVSALTPARTAPSPSPGRPPTRGLVDGRPGGAE